MRDPLAEPRTTPVSLRSSDEHVLTVHAFGLDGAACDALFDRVAAAAHALDEPVTCYGGPAFDTPPTIRDLIRAARAAGLVLKRRRHSPTWTDWYAENDNLIVEVVNDTGWNITIRATGIDINLEGSAVTLERIADAAALCGWDLGSTT